MFNFVPIPNYIQPFEGKIVTHEEIIMKRQDQPGDIE